MRRCHPSLPFLTHTSPACARCDQVERALNLFTEMEQMSLMPTHVTFNAMIHATGRSFRHAERAYGLFEQMASAGYQHDVYSLNGVLLACRWVRDVASFPCRSVLLHTGTHACYLNRALVVLLSLFEEGFFACVRYLFV